MLFMDVILVAVILMIAAILFAITEMFFPGFGFFGITSIVLFAISSILFILNVWWGIFVVFAVALLLFAILLYAIKAAKKSDDFFHRESLKEDEQSVKLPENYIGKEGVATTPLKPFGFANIEGKIMEVCSEGGKYVETGEKITVIGISDNNVVVRPESFKLSY